tara:strand:+ start:455 stop:766 length:312 start_codon:yes stop_codon:yes gene_type:complete
MNSDKLIAEFMIHVDSPQVPPTYGMGYFDWSKLMPVVEEINNYKNMEGDILYSLEIHPNHVTIRRGLHTAIVVDSPQANSLLEMIYIAVEEFARRFHQYGLSL